MLKKSQRKLYDAFYESTQNNEFLDERTELFVGLAAAIAMDCGPCMKYYLKKCKDAGIKKAELSEVIAKVMAVAAGQKKLQLEKVIRKFGFELAGYE